ncbi:MAG: CdaR family protein [Candidatus Krumholzibacteria bacterium]|nr:CdaR family protein [Candidatus Krumholzibacteria bacterium]
MRFDRVYSAVTANIGIKIVSILFAVFLWLYVTAQIGERQTFRVPLELANVPDSLAVVGDVPKDIVVTMRSTRSELLKLRFMSSIKATVDISGARRGRNIVPLSTGILRLPEGFRQEDVSIDSPKSLTLDFERILSSSLPVTPVLRGSMPKEMILVGRPTVTPDRVLVRGPMSAMTDITGVETEPIDLRNKPGKFSREVSIRADRGRQCIPSRVLVEFEIARRAVRTLEGIPPTLLHGEEGLEVEYTPQTAALTVEGPEELVNGLVPDDVSIILNIAYGLRGTVRIRPEVIVPQGIDTFSLDVSSFEVRVSSKR